MSEDIHWQKYASRFKTYPVMLNQPSSSPGLIVCIPVYAEPELINVLESLCKCDIPPIPVEVILFFNKNNKISSEELAIHEQAWMDCHGWINQHLTPGISFLPVYLNELPDPKGGVGWARKMVMDEAARRLGQDGVLLCLDADCRVEENYLKIVYDFFQNDNSLDAVSIYFEHNLSGLDSNTRRSITEYELHLRYLVHAQRWSLHPFTFHTVGSAMAVRRKAYLEHGGMNTRQAGEDFYFLQKFIEVGSLRELNQTCVYPSARISGRVPFGTGKAMQKLLGESGPWVTTNFEVFRKIRPLFNSIGKLRECMNAVDGDPTYDVLSDAVHLDPVVMDFLQSIDFIRHCSAINLHTTSIRSFQKRFFRFFNAFMMIRYMHYIRDREFADVPVYEAAQELAGELNLSTSHWEDTEELLNVFRRLDR